MNKPTNTGSLARRQNAVKTPARAAETMTVNGQQFRLTPDTVRQYLVSGNGNVSDQEVAMFIAICKDQGLNPFAKDAYLIKYGTAPAAVVTSIGAMEKRASDFPEFAGMESGIYVRTADGTIEQRNGALYIPEEETLIGGWATAYRKDREIQTHYECTLGEYIQRKSNGEPNTNWATKPAVMIRKCAKAGALREAFPKQYASVYEADEIRRAPMKGESEEESFTEPAGIPAEEIITIDAPSQLDPMRIPNEMPEKIPASDLASARK